MKGGTLADRVDNIAATDINAAVLWVTECCAVPTDIRRIMVTDSREEDR